jgi:hypothetical protein
MTNFDSVSYQAFLEEIENWELSLTREVKKLKQLRKVSSSKLQINSIDIALLAIESELMQYRKAKAKVTHGSPRNQPRILLLLRFILF